MTAANDRLWTDGSNLYFKTHCISLDPDTINQIFERKILNIFLHFIHQFNIVLGAKKSRFILSTKSVYKKVNI